MILEARVRRQVRQPVPSLRGLRGSPIFAVTSEGERARYWLYAMQVSALRGENYVSGMFMRPLAKVLQEVAERKHTLGQQADRAGNA